MSTTVIDDFVGFLAQVKEPEKRERILAQAKMRAANDTADELLEPPIRTLGKYLADEVEVPPTLVEPFIVVRGGLTCTIGRAGKGKTVMNLNRILRWAAGRPMFEGWHDADGNDLLMPARPLKILVIENEGAGGLFHRQIGIMLNSGNYLSVEDRRLAKENVLIWGDGGYSGLKLDDPAKLREVRNGCEKWEPDVLFIEPFRGLWNGEENSATDMAVVIDALHDVAADYQCGVMLAHHERKSGTGEDGEKMSAGRGSTVLEGAVTVMENFESTKGGDERRLTWSKSRHGKAPNPVDMRWDADSWWYSWVPSSETEAGVLDALRATPDGEPMNLKGLCEFLDESDSKLRGVLKTLESKGQVKKMPSQQRDHGGGTTGVRWRLPADAHIVPGGLPI